MLASSVKLLDHGGPSCIHDLASTAAEGSNWSWILLLVCTFAIICVGSMRPKMTLCLLVMVALGWCLASGLIHLKLAIANGPVLSTGKTRMSEEVLIAKAFGQRFRTVVGKVDVGGFSGQPIKINGQGFLNATTLLASLLLVVAPAACLARVVLANWSTSGESQVELDLVEPSEAPSIDLEMGLQSFDLQTSCPSNAAGTLQTRSSGECLAPAVDGNAGVFGPQPNQCHIELCQRALETQRSSAAPSVDPPTSSLRAKDIQLLVHAVPAGAQTDWDELCMASGKGNTARVRDEVKQPWSDTRHSSRFMLQPQPWSEVFDDAYLGVVEEFGGTISMGFGGTIRKAWWAEFVVASKEFHRGDAELFAELCFDLLIAPPVLGFCTTPDGDPRLISAWLPETCAQHVKRMSWSADTSKLFICDMLFALLCMHGFGLVHGDLKPDNIMVGPTGTVYLIDFGSVCRPGDPGPMSCGAYRPPEADVSISWDVYSIGLILCELGGLKG